MKLTLKEARRLENRIYETILARMPVFSVNINALESNIEEQIDKPPIEFQNDIELRSNLIRIRMQIRREIQKLNESSGINALISVREEALVTLDLFKQVLNADVMPSKEAILRQLNIKLAQLEGGNTFSHNTDVSVSLVSKDMHEVAKAKVKDCQRLIDSLDDKILAMNATTTVTLSDEHQQILADNDII